MFCKNCGKELNNGAKVCPDCGTKVSSPTSIISIFNCKGNLWGQRDEYERLLFITHSRRHQRNDATKFRHQLQ